MKWIVGILAGVGTYVVLSMMLSVAGLVSALIGVAVGAVVAIGLIAASRGENPRDVAQEVVETAREVVTDTEPKTTIDERAAQEQLFRMLEGLVTSGKAPDMVAPVTALSNELRTVVPRALEFAESSETTFNLVKLAKNDLPNMVRTFLNQSDADRAEVAEEFSAQLSGLAEKVKQLIEFIDAGRADEFDAESTFIDMKFS